MDMNCLSCVDISQLKYGSLTDSVSTALVLERSHVHSGRSDRMTGMNAIPWKTLKHKEKRGVDTELQTHRTIRYSGRQGKAGMGGGLADVLSTPLLDDKARAMCCGQLGNRTFPATRQAGTMSITASATAFGTQLTPKRTMRKNILKNTRKTAMWANAIGKIPRKVVTALITTEGPISPKTLAILASFDSSGFCSIQ